MDRGVSPETALVDAQRATLASAAHAREVSADIAQSERDLEEVARSANQIEDTRKIELIQEAQQFTEQIATVTARLDAVADKLLYVRGVGAGSLSMASRDFIARLYRGDGGAPIEVGLDTLLLPGDVIEIEIRPETLGRLLGTGEAPTPVPRAAHASAGRVRRRRACGR